MPKFLETYRLNSKIGETVLINLDQVKYIEPIRADRLWDQPLMGSRVFFDDRSVEITATLAELVQLLGVHNA